MQFDYLVLIKNYNPQDNFLINPETMKFGLINKARLPDQIFV